MSGRRHWIIDFLVSNVVRNCLERVGSSEKKAKTLDSSEVGFFFVYGLVDLYFASDVPPSVKRR